MEADVLALDRDVARKAAQAQLREPRPEQFRERDAENDRKADIGRG
jgi:hypothetical protein